MGLNSRLARLELQMGPDPGVPRRPSFVHIIHDPDHLPTDLEGRSLNSSRVSRSRMT